jgi:hypothetical protein
MPLLYAGMIYRPITLAVAICQGSARRPRKKPLADYVFSSEFPGGEPLFSKCPSDWSQYEMARIARWLHACGSATNIHYVSQPVVDWANTIREPRVPKHKGNGALCRRSMVSCNLLLSTLECRNSAC